MSNAARKERKRNGEKFVREEKVGTPIYERQAFTKAVTDRKGIPDDEKTEAKQFKLLQDRGLDWRDVPRKIEPVGSKR